MQMFLLRASLAVAFAATLLPSQEQPCDRSRIEWVLPGQFEKAQERARAEKRLILVKGISFGVDEEGAACATAGTW